MGQDDDKKLMKDYSKKHKEMKKVKKESLIDIKPIPIDSEYDKRPASGPPKKIHGYNKGGSVKCSGLQYTKYDKKK